MFRGRYDHTVDGKGRTSLPSRFRDVLAASGEVRLVVTTGLDPCLVAYPLKEWTAFEDRLSALPQFDPMVANLRRIYVSGAVDCDVDRLGRLLVPQSLREHAGIDREVVWAGMGRHIELWSKARFDALRSEVLSDAEQRTEMARRLSELGL